MPFGLCLGAFGRLTRRDGGKIFHISGVNRGVKGESVFEAQEAIGLEWMTYQVLKEGLILDMGGETHHGGTLYFRQRQGSGGSGMGDRPSTPLSHF